MNRLPIVNGVKEYIEEGNIPFCMPGHKHGKGFGNVREGDVLLKEYILRDITEVDGVDNLHNPQGIIKEGLELLRDAYGSHKAYFLVNGSTSGNLAMVFATLKEGDKIIVERNCHRSIYNAIILRKLNPVYVLGEFHDKHNVMSTINENNFIETIKQNSDAKAVILTYPNYYGICMDLNKIVKEAKRLNMIILVDSAHGAHFGFNKNLPRSAIELGADIVVMSAHKTLPSLTQTAYLHLNNKVYESKIDFYISVFSSTSPSYMFLQSMDYARFYLQEYGNQDYDKLISMCDKYKNMINTIDGFEVLDISSIQHSYFNRDLDRTRFVIILKEGFSGYKLSQYLRKNRIQVEMSDYNSVVLILSPFNNENELELLYHSIKNCDLNELIGEVVNVSTMHLPKTKFLPYEVLERDKKRIPVKDSLGKICGEAIVPYPPGIPLIMPGEIIDENVIEIISFYIDNGLDILGMYNDKIYVVE